MTGGNRHKKIPGAKLANLLLHPYFLIPTTVCNFFNKADKFLKDQEELGGENAIQIRQFKKQLNRRAKRQRIVGRNGNWKSPLIANGHLLILTTRYINGKAAKSPTPYMSRWVSDLLTVIRHKHEHFRDFPDAERQILGWLTIPEGVTIDQMYAQYWLSLYPKLLPFLWKEFYRFRNESSLMEFYSGFNNRPRLKLALKVEQLLKNIDDALTDDLHNGHLEETFVACSINLKLEIRNLSSVRISNILSKSTAVLAISMSDNGMKVLWKGVSMKPMEYNCNMNTNLKNCVLLITNNCSKIDTNILKHCVGFEKVIVLASDDNAKLTVTQKLKEKLNIEFSENPFSWADINESAYKTVLCKSVRVQGRKVSLKELLPICKPSNQTVLSKLKGSAFVKILRNEAPTLFDKCKEPIVLPTYVKRKLLKRIVVCSDILSSGTVLDSDILIICGVSFVTLKRLVGKNIKLLKIEINPRNGKYEFSDELDTKILVIESVVEYSADIFDSLKNKTWFNDSNVHCFQYNSDQTLVWVGTQGNVSVLKDFIDNRFKVEDLKFFEDDELPNSISVDDRLICICDKSGMGKSFILPKLAQCILLEPSNRLVCLLEITKFLEKLQNKAPDSYSCIRAILNLICDTELEEELATAWLNEKGSIRLEIMFDGLDELDLEKSKNVFTTAIKQITENFSTVRVWVTMRDHLVKQIQDKLDAIYVKMLPFSIQEKVECLVRNWKEYIQENKSYVEVLPTDSELVEFAKKCAEIEIFSENVDIAAVPLQCFMIAQVHAENALQRKFAVDLGSSQTITSLYETVIEQKFKLYLRRTGCGELSPDNHMYQDNYQTMLQRHFYYSLKLIISADASEWFRNTFCISIPNTVKFCNNMFAYGIIVNLDEPRFLHRTFAEYLVTLFLFEILIGNHEEIISETDSTFQDVLWNEALEMYDGVITWYPNFKKPAIASFLNSFLTSVVNPTPDLLLNSENDNKSRINTQKLRVDVKSINWMSNCFHAKFSQNLEFGYVYELVLTSRLPFRNLYYMALKCDQHTFCNQAIINSHLVHLRTRQHDVDLSLKIEWKINKKGEGMKLIQEFYNAIFPSVLNEKICPNCNIFEWIALSFSKQNKEDDFHIIEVRPTLATKQLLQHLHKNGQIQEDQLEKVNEGGRTPLHELVEKGDMRSHSVVEWIDFFVTTLKANVNVTDTDDGNNLLHSLVINVSDNFEKVKENPDPYLKVWKLLVKNGCSPMDVNFEGDTPFHLEMNWCGTDKWLLFFHEIEHFPEVVHTLDQHGSNILMVALWKRNCNLEIIQKLISLGSDVNLRNNMGKTPILLTVENDREDLYHLLKANGADDTVYDLHGNGALHYAARSGSLNMWQILEKHHLDVEHVNKKSQNILHVAVEYHRDNFDFCNVSLVELILEKYPSLIEAVDGKGNSALHYAVMTKCKNILRVMLSKSVHNILQSNNEGYSPLHLSLKVENLEVISILLEFGADFYQLNKNKECVVYIAVQNNNCNILEEVLSLESKFGNDQMCSCDFHLYTRHNKTILSKLLNNFESTTDLENLCFQCKVDIVKKCKCREKVHAIFYLWCKIKKSEKEKLCSSIISMLIKSSEWFNFSSKSHWGCGAGMCHKKEILDRVSQMNLNSEMTIDKPPTETKKQLRYNPKLGKFEIVDG